MGALAFQCSAYHITLGGAFGCLAHDHLQPASAGLFLEPVSSTSLFVVARVFNAERVETNELCLGQTCVTEEQFNSVFSNQPAAVGAPSVGNTNEAPNNRPASGGSPDTDTATSTTPAEATSTPEAANDNPQPQGAEQSSDGNEPADDAPSATEPEVEDATDQQPAWSEQPIEPPELEPANDNSPVEPLSATRTE